MEHDNEASSVLMKICTVHNSLQRSPAILKQFLANVTTLRSLYAIARPSVVCNVGAPYSAG